MYHISNDARSRKSALLICYGLTECINAKPFSEITVSDTCRAAYVGRSTFYRLFDNTADVLSYQCDLLFQDAIQSFSGNGGSPSAREYVLSFMQACLKYPKLIQAIAICNRADLLYEAHLKYSAVMKHTLFPDKKIPDIQLDYILRLLTSAMVSIVVMWVDKNQVAAIEDLYENCKASIQLLSDLLQ